MTLAERTEYMMARTEAMYGPIRDYQLSREAAVADFTHFTHEALMDGAL